MLQLYKQINKRIKHVSTFFYVLAFPIGAAVLLIATTYARILSLFKFSFQIPMLILLTASIRVDILRCLAVTYELWFFTVLNALTCILFAFHFSDLRMFMTPVYWWGIQLCVCVDAKIQDSRVVGASILAALYHIFLLVVFGLHLTPNAHKIELFRNHTYTMNTDDVLLNAFPTMMLLMARTAYRQRKFQTKEGPDQIVVRLSSVHCRVRLCEKAPATQPTGARRLWPNRHPRTDSGSTLYLVPSGDATHKTVLQRLRLVKTEDDVYSARDIVAPALMQLLLSHTAWRTPRLAGAVGGVGFALNVAAFSCSYSWNTEELHSPVFWTLSLASLLCSLLFCASMAGLYQRQLLKRLVSSFDFVFITLQNTLTYASICDLLYWDPRCITILTGWIWLVWLLTLDALTPTVRTLIGFRTKCAIPVLLFAIGVQSVVAVQIVFGNSTNVQDRVLWSVSVLGHTMHLRAVPFFLGRVITLVLWSLRVLWRLCTSSSDDLIMTQGMLEFFGSPKAIRRKVALTRRPTLTGMRRAVHLVAHEALAQDFRWQLPIASISSSDAERRVSLRLGVWSLRRHQVSDASSQSPCVYDRMADELDQCFSKVCKSVVCIVHEGLIRSRDSSTSMVRGIAVASVSDTAVELHAEGFRRTWSLHDRSIGLVVKCTRDGLGAVELVQIAAEPPTTYFALATIATKQGLPSTSRSLASWTLL